MTSIATQKSPLVLAGYNHDIPCRGEVYHVQTEQLAPAGKCTLLTEVYRQGQIVASHRSPWEGPVDSEEGRRKLALRMRHHHKTAIRCLLADQLGRLPAILEDGEPASRPTPLSPQPSTAPGIPRLSRVAPHHSGSQDLGLRRALVRFVRAVGDQPPAKVDPLCDRLRSIATAIAVLLSHEGERRLRQDDLAELMMARSETIQYLGTPDPPGPGFELWHRFSELAKLFAAINSRRALCDHDHEVLQRVLSSWETVEDPEQPPDAVSLALLKSCWGRDRVLDELLEDRRTLSVARLLPEVLRTTRELESLCLGFGGPSSPAEERREP